MINLFIDADSEKWDTNTTLLYRERCLTEHITNELRMRFLVLGNSEIAQIKEFPCIFAYEKRIEKDARIGFITDISVRQNKIKIDYQFCEETIPYQEFLNLYEQLDMDKCEEYRTHWTIKNIDIKEIIPNFYCNNKNKPTVFISYSWDSEDHKQWVKSLSDKLIENGINVILDQNDLLPGYDKAKFMTESIQNSDYILLVLTTQYRTKIDKKEGGVNDEFFLIHSEISKNKNSTKFIPIIREGQSDKVTPINFNRDIIYIEMQNDNDFEIKLKMLLSRIFSKDNKTSFPPNSNNKTT